MCDAFDKNFYYEDSDFELELNLQDKRRELIYLLEVDEALVALHSCRQELMTLLEPTPNLHTGDGSLVPREDKTLEIPSSISPPASALPLPMWAKPDVGNWLQQSMEDFTIKYYSESVQKFFESFDGVTKKTCY